MAQSRHCGRPHSCNPAGSVNLPPDPAPYSSHREHIVANGGRQNYELQDGPGRSAGVGHRTHLLLRSDGRVLLGNVPPRVSHEKERGSFHGALARSNADSDSLQTRAPRNLSSIAFGSQFVAGGALRLDPSVQSTSQALSWRLRPDARRLPSRVEPAISL